MTSPCTTASGRNFICDSLCCITYRTLDEAPHPSSLRFNKLALRDPMLAILPMPKPILPSTGGADPVFDCETPRGLAKLKTPTGNADGSLFCAGRRVKTAFATRRHRVDPLLSKPALPAQSNRRRVRQRAMAQRSGTFNRYKRWVHTFDMLGESLCA